MYKTQDASVKKLILLSPPDEVGTEKTYNKHYDELYKIAKENIANGKPRKLLPEEISDWFTLSSQPSSNTLQNILIISFLLILLSSTIVFIRYKRINLKEEIDEIVRNTSSKKSKNKNQIESLK